MGISMLKEIDSSGADAKLAFQCAPVITGLKISNLLVVPTKCAFCIAEKFEGTSVDARVMFASEKSTALLLYRRGALESYMNEAEVRDMLMTFGYGDETLEEILDRVGAKYRDHCFWGMEFPHELGLILGYPPQDVAGFIAHSGKNFLYNGYWKVYGDVNGARERFAMYDKARSDAVRLVACRRSPLELLDKYGNYA